MTPEARRQIRLAWREDVYKTAEFLRTRNKYMSIREAKARALKLVPPLSELLAERALEVAHKE